MIPNPNPVTTKGDFTGAWITNVRLSIAVGGIVSHVRFNGEFILAERPTTQVLMAENTAAIDTTIATEAQRLTGKSDLRLVMVSAPLPSRPIKITFVFSDKSKHEIPNAYAHAATDSVFAAAFTSVMTAIGNLL
jgi:hypothetical protein